MTIVPSSNLTLEVETTPPGGTLLNLVKNPSGDLGAWGWVTPVANSTMTGGKSDFAIFQQALVYSAAGGVANFFYTEPFAVTTGQYIGASWLAPNVQNYYRVKVEFLNSSKVLVSSSTQTGYLSVDSENARQYMTTFLIPTGTGIVYARLRFDLYKSNTGTAPDAGMRIALNKVTVATAATSAALNLLSYKEPYYWTNILGPSHDIKIVREELNVGTLSATVLDTSLDPATASTLRPGKLVRVMANNPDSGVYEPLFNGKIDNAKVNYDLSRSDAKQARISLTAFDNVSVLASQGRAQGVNAIFHLPYLMEGAGVPWVCDDYSGQKNLSDVIIVSNNENASLLDQIAITRDSKQGFAWVDRYGVLKAYSPTAMPQGVNLITNGTFDQNVTGWGPGSNTTIAQDTLTVYEGLGSLKVTTTTAGTSTAINSSPGIEVRPGTSYRIVAYSRAGASPRSTRIDARWYDASLTQIGTGTGATSSTTTGSWTKYSGDYVAPANAKYLRVALSVLSTAISEIHYWDSVRVEGPKEFLDESTYRDPEIDFDTERCINEISVKWLRYNGGSGDTSEVVYGPYREETSISTWGVRHADFTIQGVSESESTSSTFASNVFATNATPVVRINSIDIPVRKSTTHLALAHLDLYDLVTLINTAKSISAPARITGITHNISANNDGQQWLMTLDFASQNGVAPPQVTPSPPLAPMPAKQSGTFNLGAVAAGAFDTTTITFTSGLFTSAPKVWAIASTGRLNVAVRNITTTGCTVECFNASSASTGTSEYFQWVAEYP